MKLQIDYRAIYQYAQAVSLSPHYVRLFPRPDFGIRIRHLEFATNAGAEVHYRRDLFDNPFAHCFYPAEAERELRISLEIELELEERNPFHFLLEERGRTIPLPYLPEEQRILAPYLAGEAGAPRAGPALPFWPLPSETRDSVELLVELVGSLHQNIRYERRDQGPARSPEQTIALGAGACRDTAVLLASVLRRLGLAARLASGYLCELESGEGERRAEGALHAWTETYLPGAGWIGLDPTNGVLCDHNFIPAAVGLTPGDVDPVAGSYYGQKKIDSALNTSLRLFETR